MEKINSKHIYVKSTYPDYRYNENKKLVHFSEINLEDKGEDRRIILYSNKKVKVATIDSGYDGEEITHGRIFEDDLFVELNYSPELVTKEISKEEFESEWQKAISQPGFYLKPYSEYTDEDWKK